MNLIKLNEVMSMTSMKKSTIYAKIKKNEFPAQCKTGERSSAWVHTEIIAWIEDKISKR